MYKHTRLTVLLAAALLTASLTACGTPNQTANTDSSADASQSAADQTTQQDTAQDTRIQPLPMSFDPTKLDDCVIPISFTNDNIEKNSSGQIVISMTAYEQELLDSAEITALKAGDTLVVRGEDITVESVETAEDGVVQINGGIENGGVDMAPSKSGGTFYESTAAVYEYPYTFVEAGQLTLPVDSQNFVYTDSSDLENPEQSYTADDLIDRKDEIDFSCSAMNATAHIVSGAVESINRIYIP